MTGREAPSHMAQIAPQAPIQFGFGPIRHTRLRPIRQAFSYAGCFLRLRIEPHLENAHGHLEGLRAVIDGDSPDAEFQRTRLGKAETWHRLLNDLVPVIKEVAAE